MTSSNQLKLLKIALDDFKDDREIDDLSVVVKKAGARTVTFTVKSRYRSDTRETVEKALKKHKIGNVYRQKMSSSTFEVTRCQMTDGMVTFEYKDTKGGGSRGGTKITKKAECGQAVYAALAFNKGGHITVGDVTRENITAANRYFDIDDTVNNVLSMTEDWKVSSIVGANILWDNFKDLKHKNIKFHRGGTVVTHIENQFKRIKREEQVRININKWSPADIYITTNNYDSKCLEDEVTLKGLNQCMRTRIEDNTMFGISLKKIEDDGDFKQVNMKPKEDEKEFEQFEMTQESADCYMLFKQNAKIQFRGFDGPNSLTGWQGEVSGSSAAHGKIGMGSVNLIFKLHGVKQIPKDYPEKIRGNGKSEIEKFVRKGVKDYSKNFVQSTYDRIYNQKVNDKEINGYLYQKGLCIELIEIINSIKTKEKRDQVCNDLLLYASSESIISAPYWKLGTGI